MTRLVRPIAADCPMAWEDYKPDPKTFGLSFKGFTETSGRFPKMTKKFRRFQTKSYGRLNVSDSFPNIVEITRYLDQTISAPYVTLSKKIFDKVFDKQESGQ